MSSLEVLPYPFPEPGRYVSVHDLTLRDRLSEINTRVCYDARGKVDQQATDTWRREGIRELPHPPAGQGYFFDVKKHAVVLHVAHSGYVHERRRVNPASLEHDPRNQAKLEVARMAAEKREMQKAIRATEQELAKRRASVSKK